jgi:hydrogenase expression/formation protein HypE
MNENILIGHGSGGKLTNELVKNLFARNFANDILSAFTDSALCKVNQSNLAFTTDSYVIDPLFFPGGDIGKLAVCGTVNDLAVSGALPLYLSASFIIEEGFSIESLEKIVSSMATEAKNAGLMIVTGDTKVVNRGKCDKLFINTSGIGVIDESCLHISTGAGIQEGDKIIVNGTMGDHSIAILASRETIKFQTNIVSDCACLSGLINTILSNSSDIHFMRDVTRGGLATVLCETATLTHKGIDIYEDEIPINKEVQNVCEIFGFDPLYLANEGKIVCIVSASYAETILQLFKQHSLGINSSIIGEIVEKHPNHVVLETSMGGHRMIDMLSGEQLPRIC